jgi:peptidoglycan/xylan/chitin deacetylase (PgdA/CDA1 family)
MSQTAMAYLTYHELQIPGHSLCTPGEGYERFIVLESEFRRHLKFLETSGLRGMNVTEGLLASRHGQPGVVITFDDGSESDLLSASPALRSAGFNATFYIVVDWLGRRGWLSESQLRELSDADFEIGCHTKSHAYLTDLDATGLHEEIVKAKDLLEQIIGKRVDHLSCPGGRWNLAVAHCAREAGYCSVTTSRIGTNSGSTDPFCLNRLGVMRDTKLAEFSSLCRGQDLFLLRTRYIVLATAKRILGNSIYDKIRLMVLDRQ